MHTLLITTSSFGKSLPYLLDCLQKKGVQVVANPFCRKLTEDELKALLSKYKPLGLLAGTEPITRSVL